MNAEKLFEMAVRLVEANIGAGQMQNTMNLDAVIRDQVRICFDALAETWVDIAKKEDAVH